jgi:hypothetical protein
MWIINAVQGKPQLNSSRPFLFCQETSQFTGVDQLLSFVTGWGESEPIAVGKTEHFLLWKIILQNIYSYTTIIKYICWIVIVNCQVLLFFRQYGVSQSEWKIDRPRPGRSRLSPRPHTKALIWSHGLDTKSIEVNGWSSYRLEILI